MWNTSKLWSSAFFIIYTAVSSFTTEQEEELLKRVNKDRQVFTKMKFILPPNNNNSISDNNFAKYLLVPNTKYWSSLIIIIQVLWYFFNVEFFIRLRLAVKWRKQGSMRINWRFNNNMICQFKRFVGRILFNVVKSCSYTELYVLCLKELSLWSLVVTLNFVCLKELFFWNVFLQMSHRFLTAKTTSWKKWKQSIAVKSRRLRQDWKSKIKRVREISPIHVNFCLNHP